MSEPHTCEKLSIYMFIRESVDSLCRDGADAQYMQYLSKCRITSPQYLYMVVRIPYMHSALFVRDAIFLHVIYIHEQS